MNTALAAVNSYTLLDFSDEIIDSGPDAVLIYAGHNEFYGALGAASTASLGMIPFVVRAYLGLRTYRTLQLVRDAMTTAAGFFFGKRTGPPGQTLMERMVGEQRIPYGSKLYQMGIEQFRGNLDRLLARYADSGVPVIIGTVASNEGSQRPFISATSTPDLQARYDELLRSGTESAKRSNHEGAIEIFSAAIEIDSMAAAAFFERARSHRYLGNVAEAVSDFRASRDRDQLRFRATEDINDVIRSTAARHGAVVAEVHAALAGASPNGIIGSELILEHLHPNVEGCFIMSDVFYNTFLDSDASPASPQRVDLESARKEILLTEMDRNYGVLRVRQLKGSWPFQPPGTVDRTLDTLTAHGTVDSLLLAVFRSEMLWYEATRALRAYYIGKNNEPKALQASLAMIQQYPFLAMPYAYAGEIMARMGRSTEAALYLDVSPHIEPSVPVLIARGNLSVIRGNMKQALSFFEEARTQEISFESISVASGIRTIAGAPECRFSIRTAGMTSL